MELRDQGERQVNVVTKGGMWEPQRQWWDLPNFVKAFVGGYGCGKSFLGGKRAISLALTNAPIPIGCVSPTLVMAKRTMVPTIKELLRGKQAIFGRRAFYWKYNASDHRFNIRYRGREGQIDIYSGEDPDALKGPNLAGALIDEPFIQAYAVFTQMVARVRHPLAKKSEIDLFGTPEQLGWGYDLCNESGELREQFDVGMVRSSTRANLAITGSGYVERLESAFTGKAADAFIEGLFVNLSTGLVFYGYGSQSEAPDPTPEELKDAELGAGMDFNVNPMASTVFARMGSRLHFLEDIELPNADTEFMCAVLKEKYGDRLKNIYPDVTGRSRHSSSPGGKTDHWYIRQAGFNIICPHESPGLRDSFNCANGRLSPKVGSPLVTIGPKCKRLRKYLSVYSYERMNEKEYKAMRHLLDAFRYPICYMFPIVREQVVVQKLLGT